MAHYADPEHSLIAAEIDGVPRLVPPRGGNGLYRRLLREGVAIAAYTPSTAELKARVDALLARRLACGFDHDFAGSRGVQRIGTTPKDRDGWDEVKSIADAAVQLGQPEFGITVRTDSGQVDIRADEWAAVQLSGAAAFRPCWQASWAVKDAIDAGTVTTLAQVDAHPAWPAVG